MDAASQELASKGLAGTSIEQISERAGYTRGAFYSNFEGLEDLLLAIMDDQLDRSRQELDSALSSEGGLDELSTALRTHELGRPTRQSPGAFVLSMELWLHAMRTPRLRERLATHYSEVRSTYATVIAGICERLGRPVPEGIEELAAVLVAVDNGLLLQRLVDDSALEEDLYERTVGSVLECYLRGPSSGSAG